MNIFPSNFFSKIIDSRKIVMKTIFFNSNQLRSPLSETKSKFRLIKTNWQAVTMKLRKAGGNGCVSPSARRFVEKMSLRCNTCATPDVSRTPAWPKCLSFNYRSINKMKTRSKATKTHPGVRGTTASQSNTPTRPLAPVALLKMFRGSAKTITGVKKERRKGPESRFVKHVAHLIKFGR